jgi:DNA repair exonuclease SbcCD ATPase subunit
VDERIKRNYIQMEKEMIFDFYNNTRKELDDAKNTIVCYDSNIEKTEEEHKVFMIAYTRKLQFLEHEHLTKDCKGVEVKAQTAMENERKDFLNHEEEQKQLKKTLLKDYKKNETKANEDIKLLEEKQAGNLKTENKALEIEKNNLIAKYEEKLENLRKDLELRIKVEIHELEERKNNHINNLMSTHRKQYDKLKESYNAMTNQQVKLIKQTTNTKEDVDKRVEEIQGQIKELQVKIKKSEQPKSEAEVNLKKVEKELGTYTRV